MADTEYNCLCIPLKRKQTKTEEKLEDYAQQAMESALQLVLTTVEKEAVANGITLPDTFGAKLYEWAAKNNLIEGGPAPVVETE